MFYFSHQSRGGDSLDVWHIWTFLKVHCQLSDKDFTSHCLHWHTHSPAPALQSFPFIRTKSESSPKNSNFFYILRRGAMHHSSHSQSQSPYVGALGASWPAISTAKYSVRSRFTTILQVLSYSVGLWSFMLYALDYEDQTEVWWKDSHLNHCVQSRLQQTVLCGARSSFY